MTPAFSLGNRLWLDYNNNGVVDEREPAVADGVKVNLLKDDGTPLLGLSGAPVTTSTVGGLYLFDELLSGTYIVEVDASNFAAGGLLEHWWSSDGQSVVDDLASDDHDHGAPITSGAVRSAPVVLTLHGEPIDEIVDNDEITDDRNENLTIDFGFSTLSLGNRVFLDTVTENGKQDEGEPGVGGVTLKLWASDGTTITGTALATTTTGRPRLLPVRRTAPRLLRRAYPCCADGGGWSLHGYISTEGNGADPPDPDDSIDADDNGTQNHLVGYVDSKPVTLAAAAAPLGEADVPESFDQGVLDGNIDVTVDFGFVTTPTMSLGNRVWFDANNNGKMDTAETGIEGVKVELYLDADGDGKPDSATPFQSDVTDDNGYYLFVGLTAGKYVVVIPAAEFGPVDRSSIGRRAPVTRRPRSTPISTTRVYRNPCVRSSSRHR